MPEPGPGRPAKRRRGPAFWVLMPCVATALLGLVVWGIGELFSLPALAGVGTTLTIIGGAGLLLALVVVLRVRGIIATEESGPDGVRRRTRRRHRPPRTGAGQQ